MSETQIPESLVEMLVNAKVEAQMASHKLNERNYSAIDRINVVGGCKCLN